MKINFISLIKRALLCLFTLLLFPCSTIYWWTYEAYYDNIIEAEEVINKYEQDSFILKYIVRKKVNKAWYISFKEIERNDALILTSFIDFNNKVWKEQNFYKFENKAILCEKILFVIFALILISILIYKKSKN